MPTKVLMECRLSANQGVNGVLIECQPKCQWRVDLVSTMVAMGCRLSVNHSVNGVSIKCQPRC